MSRRRQGAWLLGWLLAAGVVALAVVAARHRAEAARLWADIAAFESVLGSAQAVDRAANGSDPDGLIAAADRLDHRVRSDLVHPERREHLVALVPGLRAFSAAARAQAALVRAGSRAEVARFDREHVDPLARAALDALTLERSRHQALALASQRAAGRASWVTAWLAIATVGLGLALRGATRERRAVAEVETRLRADRDDRFRALFDLHPSPMWVFDRETLAFVEVNEAAVRHYGWTREEFLGMSIHRVHPREDVDRLRRHLASAGGPGRPAETWRHLRRDGGLIDVEIHGTELEDEGRRRVLAVVTDVSERRRLEEDLRQAQKMEAIGRLAGGVAHDFNNIITAVQGYAGLLRRELRERPAAQQWCDEITRASERASSLTRQLLAFSRRQVIQPVVLDLNSVLIDMHRMLARLLGEDIDLVTTPGAARGHVLADPGQIEQVLLNLAVNARDAMPEGGVLTIETSDIELAEACAAGAAGLRPGRYVRLDVTDTGTGMSPEVCRHVFEPFFTTKERGQGTGLGLATVYGIVQQNGGAISVHSELGEGTTFSVHLPRVQDSGAPEPEPEPERPRPATRPASGETVLLVEDEAQLRALARTLLVGAGYRVIEAPHGEAALALAATHPQPIHLMLTDLVMPGMRGTELARRIAERRPGTRIMFMSGYADDASLRHGGITRDTPFLQKPFSPDDLLRMVRATLDSDLPERG